MIEVIRKLLMSSFQGELNAQECTVYPYDTSTEQLQFFILLLAHLVESELPASYIFFVPEFPFGKEFRKIKIKPLFARRVLEFSVQQSLR